MTSSHNVWLMAAGWGSVAAAVAHLLCMIGGPAWFRFFGAPPAIIEGIEQGQLAPYVITCGIAAVLFGWAAYAFSAAGILPRLPLLRLGLLAIIAVCLARGLCMFTPHFWLPEHSQTFRIISSTIVLMLGLCFAFGTKSVWPMISGKVLP